MIAHPLMGLHVTLEDGATGIVVAETDGWTDEQGRHDEHRLRVAVVQPTCGQCPHTAWGPVTVFRTVNASAVVAHG